MKILKAYIDEPKPKSCQDCNFHWTSFQDSSDRCDLGAEDYAHCPLVYAPSRSVMRRLDIQMPLESENE